MSTVLKVAAGVILALVVAVVGCGALISTTVDDAGDSGDGPRSVSGNTEHPPADDVELASCETDDLGYLSSTLRITNHSDGASNYVVTVAFESPDGSEQYGTGAAYVDGLAAGQSTTTDVAAFVEAPGSDFECVITEADRFASPGA